MVWDWMLQIACSFVATTGIAALFNAPRNRLIHCGLVGVVGWVIYYLLIENGADEVPATFAGSFVIALVAHLLARLLKMPVIVFSVAGIIPFVPGGMAYEAMRALVVHEYIEGLEYAVRTAILTGTIVLGFGAAEVPISFLNRRKKAPS